MITFYGYHTINSLKVLLMLMETETPFEFVPINIRAGDQRQKAFLNVNPLGRVPVIVDGDLVLSESNAILTYLADKTGWGGLDDPARRAQQMSWLFYQASTQGPFFGQIEYWAFLSRAPNPEALAHYKTIAARSIAYLNDTLSQHRYVSGPEVNIADLALFPWVTHHAHLDLPLTEAPHVEDWLGRMQARSAIQRAYDYLAPYALPPLSRG